MLHLHHVDGGEPLSAYAVESWVSSWVKSRAKKQEQIHTLVLLQENCLIDTESKATQKAALFYNSLGLLCFISYFLVIPLFWVL